MPATLETQENGHIQYYTFTDSWTITDFTRHFPPDMTHRDSVDFPVHTIYDLTGITTVSREIISTRQRLPSLVHARSGYTVLVGATPFLCTLAKAFCRVARFERVKFFETKEEGLTYIRSLIENEG